MRIARLVALAAALRAWVACGVVLGAPASCGGSRLATHTAARFGRPLASRATPLLAYAPKPASVGAAPKRPWWRARARASPHTDALSELCAPLDARGETLARGRVLFALRGSCDFARKAVVAQEAGALGVVVVNARHAGQLVNMKLNDTLADNGVKPDISIPAVMVRFSEWQRVAACRDDGLTVTLTSDGEAVYDIDYGRDALNWAMMRGMALWILCQCGVNVVRYKRRVSESRARASAIAALPQHAFGSSEHDALVDADDDTVCAVCLDGFHVDELVRLLPCNHLYHRHCIDPYVERVRVKAASGH